MQFSPIYCSLHNLTVLEIIIAWVQRDRVMRRIWRRVQSRMYINPHFPINVLRHVPAFQCFMIDNAGNQIALAISNVEPAYYIELNSVIIASYGLRYNTSNNIPNQITTTSEKKMKSFDGH